MATLVITEGPAGGVQFALGEHRLVMIGRDDVCTFQILDSEVSRRHMQIKRDEKDRHVAIDFGSANGVLVNRQRIERDTPLLDGDQITIGNTTMLYMTQDSPDAQTIHDVLHKRGEWGRSTLIRDDAAGGM